MLYLIILLGRTSNNAIYDNWNCGILSFFCRLGPFLKTKFLKTISNLIVKIQFFAKFRASLKKQS